MSTFLQTMMGNKSEDPVELLPETRDTDSVSSEEPDEEPTGEPSTKEADEDENDDDDDDDDDDDEKEGYLQKLQTSLKSNIVDMYHPEMKAANASEVEVLCQLVHDEHGNIVDSYHQSPPFLTKYERTRVLGERARQLDAGAIPMVKVEKDCIDGYLIAVKELEEKKIPFIIKRPMPNGTCEFWKLSDLENLE